MGIHCTLLSHSPSTNRLLVSSAGLYQYSDCIYYPIGIRCPSAVVTGGLSGIVRALAKIYNPPGSPAPSRADGPQPRSPILGLAAMIKGGRGAMKRAERKVRDRGRGERWTGLKNNPDVIGIAKALDSVFSDAESTQDERSECDDVHLDRAPVLSWSKRSLC